MFNKLTCKVRFHIAVWSLSECYKNIWLRWELSSNQYKTNRFPAKFAREALTKLAVLYQSFFSETDLENSCKIPAKSAVFPRICPWKSREIWLFFPQLTRSPDYTVKYFYNVIKCGAKIWPLRKNYFACLLQNTLPFLWSVAQIKTGVHVPVTTFTTTLARVKQSKHSPRQSLKTN